MFFKSLAVVFLFYLSLFPSCRAVPAAHKPEILQPKAFINREISVYPRLEFITRFSTCIPSNTDIRIKWKGGSGEGVEMYYIPQWPGQIEYFVSFFESRITTAHHANHYLAYRDRYNKVSPICLAYSQSWRVSRGHHIVCMISRTKVCTFHEG